MGSWLSGRPAKYPSDDLSGCLPLDVAWLHRAWRPSSLFIAQSFSGAQHGHFEIWNVQRAEGVGQFRIEVRRRTKSGAYEALTQIIRMEATACNFGGERWYFVCPHTGRRCLKLFLPPNQKRFLSRGAYRLAYQVGRENGLDRAHRRLGKIFSRLKLPYDGPDLAYPLRPKGMHAKTFKRLERQAEQGLQRLELAYDAGLKRINAALENAEKATGRRFA